MCLTFILFFQECVDEISFTVWLNACFISQKFHTHIAILFDCANFVTKWKKNATRKSNIYCRTKQTTTLPFCLGHATLQTQTHKIYFKREDKMKNTFFNGSSTYTPSDCTYFFGYAFTFSTDWKYENKWIAFTFSVSKQWTLFAAGEDERKKNNPRRKMLWVTNSLTTELLEQDLISIETPIDFLYLCLYRFCKDKLFIGKIYDFVCGVIFYFLVSSWIKVQLCVA